VVAPLLGTEGEQSSGHLLGERVGSPAVPAEAVSARIVEQNAFLHANPASALHRRDLVLFRKLDAPLAGLLDVDEFVESL
jgi:hypothetical protein